VNMPDLDTTNPVLPGSEIVARIKEALAHYGTHTWDDLQELLITGAAQVFYNDHGAWITELMVSPRQRWLNVWIIAGQLPEVMELQAEVERFCLTKGLDRMVAVTRPGWEALANKDGWEKYGWSKSGVVLQHAVEGV